MSIDIKILRNDVKCTHDSFPNVLRAPKSGISPEKKLVDKFLRQITADTIFQDIANFLTM